MNFAAFTTFPIPLIAVICLILSVLGAVSWGWVGAIIGFLLPIVVAIALAVYLIYHLPR